jgi:hypothetical protein
VEWLDWLFLRFRVGRRRSAGYVRDASWVLLTEFRCHLIVGRRDRRTRARRRGLCGERDGKRGSRGGSGGETRDAVMTTGLTRIRLAQRVC